jgi:hypothetical protein
MYSKIALTQPFASPSFPRHTRLAYFQEIASIDERETTFRTIARNSENTRFKTMPTQPFASPSFRLHTISIHKYRYQ